MQEKIRSAPVTEGDLDVFEVATRDLVGVALRSLTAINDVLTLPQFRLMLVLHEQRALPSTHVAQALGLAGSSVTRMADKLCAAGYVERGNEPSHRSVVTLSLTTRGHAVVREAVADRRRELAQLLERLDPQTRAACVAGLRELHVHAGDEYTIGTQSPVPL